MSFLTSLAKGFIRSAVNQVGRDGGKVVSNNIYGNSHSTPIRNSDNEVQNFITDDNSKAVDRADLLKEGFKEELFSNGFILNCFIGIGSFLLPIFGSIYLAIKGLTNFSKNSTKFYTFKQQAVYKSDKRFSSGTRITGYENVKVYTIHKIIATKSERFIYFTKGVVALALAYFAFNFWFQLYVNWNSREEINIEMHLDNKIAIAKNFISLQVGPHKQSETLESIFTSDTLILLNEIKKDNDSVTTWYKVKHKEVTGWVYNRQSETAKN